MCSWTRRYRTGHARSVPRPHSRGTETYRVVDDILGAGIVVDVDGDPAQGGDLGGELGEPRVVLALALVGVGHVVCMAFEGNG